MAETMEMSPLERAAYALECEDSSDYYEKQTKDYRRMVRAVLEAIREPSEGMAMAGDIDIDQGISEPSIMLGSYHAREVWQRMIDTLLTKAG